MSVARASHSKNLEQPCMPASTELSEWPKQSKPANNFGTLSYFGADFMGLFQVGAASIQDGFYFNSIRMEKSI